jgi:hypothetical protein
MGIIFPECTQDVVLVGCILHAFRLLQVNSFLVVQLEIYY